MLPIICALGYVGASFLFHFLSKYLPLPSVAIIGSLLVLALISLPHDKPTVFLVVFLVAYVGRVLVDYALMRRKKIPFWDVLMGKPTACSVYHIVTERQDVSIEELRNLKSLPSVHMMDNRLFYGDFEIIGNIPLGEKEDYPIMYGDSISALEKGVMLQCGKLYRKIEGEKAFSFQFRNHRNGFDLCFKLPVLRQCIEAGSNEPYWAQHGHYGHQDLRNPKFRAELEQVAAQFGLDPAELSVTYQEG